MDVNETENVDGGNSSHLVARDGSGDNNDGEGFAIGAGLKGGLAVFSILARLKSRRNISYVRKSVGMLSNGKAELLLWLVKRH
ncbi:hypothetical protein IFM89_031368 [Coptis chinensis]|uniref:Uncharacterized protein n=1 Tax=Coptis chinensis TaxID=261450 RepID=A0A835IZG9_9MAGN|nr:hypothetical protein IFM89_031368 [Coptis chinensis]